MPNWGVPDGGEAGLTLHGNGRMHLRVGIARVGR